MRGDFIEATSAAIESALGPAISFNLVQIAFRARITVWEIRPVAAAACPVDVVLSLDGRIIQLELGEHHVPYEQYYGRDLAGALTEVEELLRAVAAGGYREETWKSETSNTVVRARAEIATPTRVKRLRYWNLSDWPPGRASQVRTYAPY
jgi:hypothetical protein